MNLNFRKVTTKMNPVIATHSFFILLYSITAIFAQCPSEEANKLRFVAQLTMSGCPIFVHDTGAPDGPHLGVEPLMCVTERLGGLFPRVDPFRKLTYVSVAVTIRDDTVLEEVRRQLRHLSPKSVKFVKVSDIQVQSQSFTFFSALEFRWNPEDPVGYLRLAYTDQGGYQGRTRTQYWGRQYCEQEIPINLRLIRFNPFSLSGITCAMSLTRGSGLPVLARVQSRKPLATSLTAHWVLSRINVSANVELVGGNSRLNYQLMVQNHSFINPEIYSTRYTCLKPCNNLYFVRSIRVSNCTARVHQRRDSGTKGHFLIEPLLCHNITSMSNDSIMYDISRNSHYLKLDIILKDDSTLDAVRTHLADLSPREISFLRLWRAPSSASATVQRDRNFEFVSLMVSSDGSSGVLQVYCSGVDDCSRLRSILINQPEEFWACIDTSLSSITSDGSCLVRSSTSYHYCDLPRFKEVSNDELWSTSDKRRIRNIILAEDGRPFVVIQQRIKGHVSFQRSWDEYKNGFGDETDFWIGLSAIYMISSRKTTLRLEMKLWNGTDLFAEYEGFRVLDSSFTFLLEAGSKLVKTKSNIEFNAFGTAGTSKSVKFSTNDRDNDVSVGSSCSSRFGKAGWWFYNCTNFNPNGVFGGGDSEADMTWMSSDGSRLALREVRLMLQIRV